MTPRERVHAVLRREIPDRLPRELKFTPPLLEEFKRRTGATDPYEHFNLEVRDVFFRPPESNPDFSAYYPDGLPPLPNPAGWEVGEWGVGQTPGSMLHFIHIEHPMRDLTSLNELRSFPWPDLTRPERHQHLEAEVKALHDRDLFVIGFMEWTIFEIAWHMRGMDNLFVDIVENPEFVEFILEEVCEQRCFQARRFAEAGVDLIKIGDDIGTQRGMLMAPDMYREWFKPRHARVIAAARAVRPDIPVCYHSDGDCWDAIPDLIEAGVTVLNPIQPECLDLAAVKREFGKDLVFWGGIGTQTTMPFASAIEAYDMVHQTIETLGPTGYFPCPTHVLEPEVPWENVRAYLGAVWDYKTNDSTCFVSHGTRLNAESAIQDATRYARVPWARRPWVPHRWVLCVTQDDGAADDVFVVLAEETDTDAVQRRVDELSAGGWHLTKPPGFYNDSHDHCPICTWALAACDDPERTEGYWSDEECEWLCVECYEKLVRPRQPD